MTLKGFLGIVCTVCVLGALGLGGYVLFKDAEAPLITLSPSVDSISPKKELTLNISDPSGIRSVSVFATKGTDRFSLIEKNFVEAPMSEKLTFTLKDSGLRDGAFELEVVATDASFASFGKGNTGSQRFAMQLDSRPPRVITKTTPPYVRRGGAGVVAYNLSEKVGKTGVRVGDLFFPAYLQPSGEYLCFFAFPHFLTIKEFSPELMAEDLAGNVTAFNLPLYPIDKQFRHDNISLSDNFLNSKMPEFADRFPEAQNTLELFLLVNRSLRKANEEKLLELGRDTTNTMAWKGAFDRLPRSANRAGFADHRSYIYNGKTIDEQTHLGLDLASTAMADIPAANHGRVIFADDLGIYGLMVLVDHGAGVMSLYSHMSEIAVDVGTEVEKGDILGKTGTTGMAGGDHLHFGVLISGVEVQPLEWLDGRWIDHNIYGRLQPQ